MSNASPDVAGPGRVECACGGLRIGPITGSNGCTLSARCPSCGQWIEAWPDRSDRAE